MAQLTLVRPDCCPNAMFDPHEDIEQLKTGKRNNISLRLNEFELVRA